MVVNQSRVLHGLAPLINICKNYIFKAFVKTVEATSLTSCTILKLVTLHPEKTAAQVNMQIFPMHMRKLLFY